MLLKNSELWVEQGLWPGNKRLQMSEGFSP